MANQLVLCAAILLLINSFYATPYPSFCKHLECPRYKVLQRLDGYEIREYHIVNWVTAQIPSLISPFWEDRSRTNETFFKLFNYISGQNDQKMKIEMTAPVFLTHQETNVSMAFMIPERLSSNIPKPTNRDVYIFRGKVNSVYVRSFGGFPYGSGNRNYFKDYYKNLTASLDRDGQKYRTDMFFTASYDGPKEKTNRHNEVWIV